MRAVTDIKIEKATKNATSSLMIERGVVFVRWLIPLLDFLNEIQHIGITRRAHRHQLHIHSVHPLLYFGLTTNDCEI